MQDPSERGMYDVYDTRLNRTIREFYNNFFTTYSNTSERNKALAKITELSKVYEVGYFEPAEVIDNGYLDSSELMLTRGYNGIPIGEVPESLPPTMRGTELDTSFGGSLDGSVVNDGLRNIQVMDSRQASIMGSSKGSSMRGSSMASGSQRTGSSIGSETPVGSDAGRSTPSYGGASTPIHGNVPSGGSASPFGTKHTSSGGSVSPAYSGGSGTPSVTSWSRVYDKKYHSTTTSTPTNGTSSPHSLGASSPHSLGASSPHTNASGTESPHSNTSGSSTPTRFSMGRV